MKTVPPGPRLRLAELLAVLSLGVDLGLGQPMEHVLRQCLIALRLAERIGMDESERQDVYYISLLAWVGCHVDAFEQAKWFGDDMVLKHDYRLIDGAGRAFMLRHVGTGKPLFERARVGLAFMGKAGRQAAEDMLANHCLAADDLAERLRLSRAVRDSLAQAFERWDGKGSPGRASGERVLIPSRLVTLADIVVVYHRAGGLDAAVSVARERSGTQFDPALVELFCREASGVCADIDSATTWEDVISAEPGLQVVLSEEESDAALEAIANFTDLKSPYTLGHSRAVADLAAAAAQTFGLSNDETETVRRAALLNDLGRLGISNAIWDKKTALTPSELERIRFHPYLTERMLASSAALAPLGAIAIQHHERLDGSGYPRGVKGDSITPAGRILAAADTYHAKLEPRPHRPEQTPEEAATFLRAEVRAGRLDGGAVDAVLNAAGHPVRLRRDWPAGLTAREVEVLRLAARGLSVKEIAHRLTISQKTASNHVEHIYAKIGVSNRARASLFAVQHGLITDPVENT
ncbi:MAG: HD domain-containing phosphohydrolase [Actinomycetota bacterium]